MSSWNMKFETSHFIIFIAILQILKLVSAERIELEQQRKYDSGGKNGKSFDNRQMQEHSNNTNYLQGEVENNQESSCKKCGKSKIDKGGKIIHGEVIPLNKYPWIVPVIAEAGARVKSCGGAVISKQYVLTAAHCIFYDLKANISICQGPGIPEECFVKPENSYIKLLGKEKLGKEVRIKRLIPHPEFINKPEQVTSDVALLELAETLQCGEMTSPICIANNEELYKKDQKIFVAGWGQHELKSKSVTEKLREGLMMEVLSEKCMKPGYSKDIANQLYCAAGTNQTACQGDSGSSAFINSEETFYSLGIVSYRGSESCDPKLPVTFAKTLYFLEWIKEHVKDLPEPE